MMFSISKKLMWRKEGNNLLILPKSKNLLIFGKEVCDLFDDDGNYRGSEEHDCFKFLCEKEVLEKDA